MKATTMMRVPKRLRLRERCQAGRAVQSVLVTPQDSLSSSTPLFERKTLYRSDLADTKNKHIAYEILQGQQAYEMVHDQMVAWTRMSPDPDMQSAVLSECIQGPPTAVLVHGMLGSRRNMNSFAHMLLKAFPDWQVLLVDLRCHGESAELLQKVPAWTPPPHTVAAAGVDVLKLLRDLRLFPRVIMGHSFGGKVVMSMAQQFGRLPRPVQVWVLDSMPGPPGIDDLHDPDHPKRLINALMGMPLQGLTRASISSSLLACGFSEPISKWASTNLRPSRNSDRMEWSFDLHGIREMYESFEVTSMWPLLEAPPDGVKLHFVRAEHSSLQWSADDESRIKTLGHEINLLQGSGHWVHTDNPQGLLNILARDFGNPEIAGRR